MIYIAGKYNGLPHDAAFKKFCRTEAELIDAGIPQHEIYNPLKHVTPGLTWDECKDQCKAAIKRCSTIFMQSDWKESTGARAELKFAAGWGLDIIFEEDGGVEEIRNLVDCGIL